MRNCGFVVAQDQLVAAAAHAAAAQAHRHCKPRTRRDVTIWSLPEEIVLLVFRYVHVRDLLVLQRVHPWFKQLTDANGSVWRHANFQDTWPTMPNLQHFEKAAEYGNLAALLKLGIAYLYNEGLPGDSDGTRINVNGEKAAEMFCKVECMQQHSPLASGCSTCLPFTWLFVRPPWSTNGSCCKEIAFHAMCRYAETTKEASVVACVAKIAIMLEGQHYRTMALRSLEIAGLGSSHTSASVDSSYLLWCHQYGHKVAEKSLSVEQVRLLRDVVTTTSMHPDAHCTLAMIYAAGNYGGITRESAAHFVRLFLTKAAQTHVHELLQHSSEITHSMRFILVDWLVEVVTMKGLNSLTLHTCINIVDRYLECHSVTRSTLQLLGVAAMVICSRCLGKDIITISEACWLTDNSYQYEDVVRMMAEIVATLRGRVRILTAYDCLRVTCAVVGTSFTAQCLAEYYSELVLLHSDISSSFRPAIIAASCVSLAQLSIGTGHPWPQNVVDFTGITVDMIKACTLQIRTKCCKDAPPSDQRDAKLQAVWSRYDSDELCKVSRIDPVNLEKLWSFLGVSNNDCSKAESAGTLRFRNTANLIASPSLTHKGCPKRSPRRLVKDRQSKTSLIAEQLRPAGRRRSTSDDGDEVAAAEARSLNDSIVSGYDGDREDADDTVQEFADDDTFLDQKSNLESHVKDDLGFPYDKMGDDYDNDDEDDDEEVASLYRSGISIRFPAAGAPLESFGASSRTSVQLNSSGIVILHQGLNVGSSHATAGPSDQRRSSVGSSSANNLEQSATSSSRLESRHSHHKRRAAAAAAASGCGHAGLVKRVRRT